MPRRHGMLLCCLTAACASANAPAPRPPSAATASIEPARPQEPGARIEKPATTEVHELMKDLESSERLRDPTERWLKRDEIITKIRALADPRGADALARYLERDQAFPRPSERAHVRTQVGWALAELGDARAVPALAERLGQDPQELYAEEPEHEAALRRTDLERVVSARLIADLTELHPNERERIRNQAEQAVWSWISSQPAPHANGLRALARMRTDNPKIRQQLRKWAAPSAPLPKVGQQPPFPAEFEVAQSSLRYLGALQDEQALGILEKQLRRRPKNFDATMDGMLQVGGALLGMSLRALEVGAANGLSELGDRKAFASLTKLIADDKENEQARTTACEALVWLADDAGQTEIAKRIEAWRPAKDDPTRFRLGCLLAALARRPLAKTTQALVSVVESGSDEHRTAAAIALGKAGVEAETEAKLIQWLGDPTRGVDAALALLIGGSIDAVKRTVEAFPEKSGLAERFSRSIGSVSQEDLDRGRLFRWARNAVSAPQPWPRSLLKKQLDEIVYDAGPHTLTRVVLRRRLVDLAKSAAPDQKKSALLVLEMMGERGALSSSE